MSIRQFNLTNANGQVFDMMRTDAFFNNPTGFGWGVTDTVLPIGNGYIVTDTKPNQPAPSGRMVFAGYAQYDEFLAFVQVGDLVLGYNTLGKWKYLDVSLTISKGEIDSSSKMLLCDVSFTAHSGWYEKLAAYQAQDAGSGKVYPYTYLYTYSSSVPGTVDIVNGNLESYPKITIFGPVTNPFWALYKGADRLETGRVKVTIPSGNKLVIDSTPATMEIAEYTAAGTFIADRYQDSDFTTARLFMLPPGNCRIVFTQERVGTVNAFVEVKKRV